MFVVYVFCALASLATAMVLVAVGLSRSRRERCALVETRRAYESRRRETDRLEEEVLHLRAAHSGMGSENTELRRRMEALDLARTHLETQAAELLAETTTADTVIRNLSDEHRRRQEAEKAHAAILGELERTSRELDETRRALDSERKERESTEQLRATEGRSLSQLKSECDRLTACLSTADKKAQRTAVVEKELAAASREVGETRRLLALERAERVRTDQKHAAACNSIRELEAERTRSQQQLTAARDSLRELEAERTRLLARLEASERKARASDVLEKELAAAHARTAHLEQLQADHAALRQAQQAEHEELSELKARLVDTSSKWRSEQAKSMASEALYQDLMLRSTAAQAGLRELRARAERAESRVAELESARRQDGEATEANERLAELEARAALAQADLRDARLKLQGSEAKLATLEQLRSENLALREQRRDAAETAQLLSAAQTEVRELRAKLQAVVPKLEEFERLGQENRALREQVAELAPDRDAADVLERMTAEHKRLRLESELMTRRLQELEGERLELFELRTRVQELSTIADEVIDLRRHEAELEAQLFSTIRHSQTIPGVETGGLRTLSEVDEAPDTESVLCSMVGPGRARSAALADGLGLLVAGAGERDLGEGLAAFAGLAGEMAERARTLLPIGQMVRVSLSAANDVKLSCRFFHAAGIEYGLATIATGNIEGVGDERAVDTLATVLSSEHAELAEIAAS
jgi:hypothetical protein